MLSESDGDKLLKLARDSIQSYFSKTQLNLSEFHTDSKFNKKQGVFVTLNKNKELRGCIGFPYPTKPLYQAIFEAAQHSAFEDPRFQNILKNELNDIQIEISVLSVPKEINNSKNNIIEQINIGNDGLIIQTGFTSGLLLPQVFIEHKSTKEQALAMTCQKAGLPDNAWQRDEVKVLKFQAQIFKEHS